MALPSTVYRATVQLSDVDRGLYETMQVTVARHPSETEERLVARLLAFTIFFEPDLTFTKGISAGDEPDLWVKGPDGRVAHWLEVGLPEPDRLIKASRHAEKVSLVAVGRSFPVWELQNIPKLVSISNLTVISFHKEFISRLAALLERAINWSVTITEGSLYLTVAGETLETSIIVLVGGSGTR